jgi:hypothetical protein
MFGFVDSTDQCKAEDEEEETYWQYGSGYFEFVRHLAKAR